MSNAAKIHWLYSHKMVFGHLVESCVGGNRIWECMRSGEVEINTDEHARSCWREVWGCRSREIFFNLGIRPEYV